MKKLLSYTNFILVVIPVYIIVINIRKEVFPVFSWSLFTSVPNQVTITEIRVLEGKNVNKQKAGEIFDEKDFFLKDIPAINVTRLISSWSDVLYKKTSGDPLEKQHNLIKSAFKIPFDYEVTFKKYHPLKKWYLNESSLSLSLGVYRGMDLLWDSCHYFHPTKNDIDLFKNKKDSTGVGRIDFMIKGNNYCAFVGWAADTVTSNIPERIFISVADSLISVANIGFDRKDIVKITGQRELKECGFFILLPLKYSESNIKEISCYYLEKDNTIKKLYHNE